MNCRDRPPEYGQINADQSSGGGRPPVDGPEAGITRDAIEIPMSFEGRELILTDTAGMRRRARIEEDRKTDGR